MLATAILKDKPMVFKTDKNQYVPECTHDRCDEAFTDARVFDPSGTFMKRILWAIRDEVASLHETLAASLELKFAVLSENLLPSQQDSSVDQLTPMQEEDSNEDEEEFIVPDKIPFAEANETKSRPALAEPSGKWDRQSPINNTVDWLLKGILMKTITLLAFLVNIKIYAKSKIYHWTCCLSFEPFFWNLLIIHIFKFID